LYSLYSLYITIPGRNHKLVRKTLCWRQMLQEQTDLGPLMTYLIVYLIEENCLFYTGDSISFAVSQQFLWCKRWINEHLITGKKVNKNFVIYSQYVGRTLMSRQVVLCIKSIWILVLFTSLWIILVCICTECEVTKPLDNAHVCLV